MKKKSNYKNLNGVIATYKSGEPLPKTYPMTIQCGITLEERFGEDGSISLGTADGTICLTVRFSELKQFMQEVEEEFYI